VKISRLDKLKEADPDYILALKANEDMADEKAFKEKIIKLCSDIRAKQQKSTE
jgi:hypothetical protein